MPTVTRTHPVTIGTGLEYFIGKPCTMFEVDFGAAVNAKTGPESTIAKVVETIAGVCEIVVKGDLHGTNQIMNFIVAHGNESDDYDGSNNETLIAHIEDLIQGLGIVDSIDLGSASATVKTSFDLA